MDNAGRNKRLTMSLIKISSRVFTAVALTGVTLTLFFSGTWPLETASYGVPGYLLLAITGACGCALSRGYRWASAGALCVLVTAVLMAPQYLPRLHPNPETSAPVLRVLQANVYYHGNDPEALLRLVRETHPDMVLLQEVDDKWKALLKPLEEVYTHHRYSPRYTEGGLDLAQFWSLETRSVTDLHGEGLPAVETILPINGRTLRVLNAHTASPFTRGRAERYHTQMDLLAQYVARQEHPVLLAGDLNAGPWSKPYKNLLERSTLSSARKGFGALGTWPSFLGPLRIALDHLLVSDGIQVLQCQVGPGIGSDHRPLLTELKVE